MTSIALTPAIARTTARTRDVSFDYLKATLVLMVVAHHSCLAYTTFAHFDPARYFASEPVVDSVRWRFFDYAENFNDVFFMSLMFFISGLLVLPSLRRSGPAAFLRDRLLRLGVPFVAGVLLVMPLAYYASWQLTGHDSGYLAYWHRNLAIDGSPPGPLWFIWLLLFFDLLAAGACTAWNGRGASALKDRPLLAALLMFAVCAAVYLPARAAFGFGAWGAFFVRPLDFQLSRFALYLAWFAAGAWIGGEDLERGLLARDGALARHWRWWVLACFIAYNALIAAALTVRGTVETVLWVASCVASCFAFLALFRGAVRTRRRWMDSLSRAAYVIYLVHYVYVLWLQRMLLGVDAGAGVKFLCVFAGAATLSWLTAQCLFAIPPMRRIL